MTLLEPLREALRTRLSSTAAPGELPTGPSMAYVLGAVVALFLAICTVTGIALAFFYSPSSTDAWASVAYLEDQISGGSFVRGLHSHGASALVIACGLHLAQSAWLGAYRRPRELTWYAGLALLLLVLGAAITGFVLRWDQAGFWANKVELGIAAETPVVGSWIARLALGGNDYGNLTLTRFYALHVAVVPLLLGGLVGAHLWLARRHGPVAAARGPASPRWPAQTVRSLAAACVALAALFAWVHVTGGAGLEAPADPTAAYDARPLWYFRWLFALRKLAGSWEAAAALVAPGLVLGYLAAMPLLDRGDAGARRPLLVRGGFFAMCAAITALTIGSLRADATSQERAKHVASAAKQAATARRLAKTYGVPTEGALAVYKTVPMWRGRSLWERHCKDCHQGKDRKGPLIDAGYGSRAWISRVLTDPGGDEQFGRTEIAKQEGAMKPVTLTGPALAAMVELVYGESGADDVDRSLAAQAVEEFEKTCSDCHSREDGVASSGPALARRGSLDSLVHFMGNPTAPIHFGEAAKMPRFDKELSMADREAIGQFLRWLRDATPADVAKLEPLP